MEAIIPMTHVRNLGLSEVNICQAGRILGVPREHVFQLMLFQLMAQTWEGDSGIVCSMETEKGLPESHGGRRGVADFNWGLL